MTNNAPPTISDYGDAPTSATPAWAVIVAWLIVGVPALWGVSQTAIKSVDLFRSSPAASSAGSASPATMPSAATAIPSLTEQSPTTQEQLAAPLSSVATQPAP